MATLLGRLLAVVKVAVISGRRVAAISRADLYPSAHDGRLKNLSLLPTCGTKFYRRNEAGESSTRRISAPRRRTRIIDALNKALDGSGFRAARCWGDVIEDRGSQITLSALGQNAPLEAKKGWDPDFSKREKIKAILEPWIPGFSVHLGGATSIDVTRPGIDKAYGIRKLHEMLDVEISDMVFVGDAIFPGGNDYPAKQAGVLSIEVRDPHETKRVIEAMIACL